LRAARAAERGGFSRRFVWSGNIPAASASDLPAAQTEDTG
jgi:hypothetical protein